MGRRLSGSDARCPLRGAAKLAGEAAPVCASSTWFWHCLVGFTKALMPRLLNREFGPRIYRRFFWRPFIAGGLRCNAEILEMNPPALNRIQNSTFRYCFCCHLASKVTGVSSIYATAEYQSRKVPHRPEGRPASRWQECKVICMIALNNR